MSKLVATKRFLKDIEKFQTHPLMRKKIAQTLKHLERDPRHPGLHLEKIVDDPTAWSVRLDRRYRLSLEIENFLESGTPDWSGNILLLRVLDHDDLYQSPH